MSDLTMFPMNVIDEVVPSLKRYMDSDVTVIERPLRLSDAPSRIVGVFPTVNEVVSDSAEIGGSEPTLELYHYRIQCLVKGAVEEYARRLFAVDTKVIKTILYRDPLFLAALGALSDTSVGQIERFKLFGVQAQRYLNSELQGTFMYLSVTEFWVQTEVSPA